MAAFETDRTLSDDCDSGQLSIEGHHKPTSLRQNQKLNVDEITDEMVALIFDGILLRPGNSVYKRGDALIERLEALLGVVE